MSEDYITTIEHLRTSNIFRVNVIFINILLVISILLIYKAIREIKICQIFHKSSAHLLIFKLLYRCFQNISYCYIQNWSIYRSLKFGKTEVLRSMFTSIECFPHHVFNDYLKTLIMIMQSVLTIDLCLSLVFQHRKSTNKQGYALNFLVIMISLIIITWTHWQGPISNTLVTSCFRETDIVVDLKSEHIIVYLSTSIISIIMSLSLIMYIYRCQKTSFNLLERYERQEIVYSAIVVSIVGIIELTTYSAYNVSLTFFASQSINLEGKFDAALIGWFYTGPYNSIILPFSLLLYISTIRRKRKKRIHNITHRNVGHSAYFGQLSKAWA